MKPKKLLTASTCLLIAIAMLAGCATTTGVDSPALTPGENTILIVIDDPRSELRRRGAGPGYSARLAYQDDPALHRYASAIAKDHALTILDEWPVRNLGVHCFVVREPSTEIVRNLRNDKRVRWVQRFNEFELQTRADESVGMSADSMMGQFTADFSARGKDVKIVVIDTAVDQNHPDLRKSSLTVRNFAGERGRPEEETHGTAVVGLIVANPDSPDGVTGLASDANVHLLRGCWQEENGEGKCNTLTLALALDAAIDLRPDIINLSLTGGRDRILDELLAILVADDTLVVAAYDENRNPLDRFPHAQAGVVYAFGVDDSSRRLDAADVLYAPKHAVSLTPMAGYDLVSGHSIATPQLAAMAACLIGLHSNATRSEIVARLGAWLEQNYAVRSARSKTERLRTRRWPG